MKNFVSIILPTKQVKKSLINHMISSADLPFNESTEYNYALFEDHNGNSVLRLETPTELTPKQSDQFAKKLAEKMFKMGYDGFDIEVSTSDISTLSEAQQIPELDAIVTKYAKAGIQLSDIPKMEAEAKAAKPQDAKADANVFQKIGAGLNKLGSTESYRVNYVLAKAAESLNMPGMYGSDGNFHYMENGEPTAAAGANLDQVVRLSLLGLVPPDKVEKIEKNFAWDKDNKKLQNKIQTIKKNQADFAQAPDNTANTSAAPQTNAELDTDAKDSGTPKPADQVANNPFAKMNKVQANQAAYDRLVQLKDLLTKSTSESISYKDNTLLESLFEDAASDAQIKKLVDELKQLRDFVSPANQQYIDKYVSKAEPVIAKMQQPTAAQGDATTAKPGGKDFTKLDSEGDEPRFQVELLGKGRVLKGHKGDKIDKTWPFVDVDRERNGNKFRVRVYAPAPRLDAFLKKQGLTPVNSGNGYNGTGKAAAATAAPAGNNTDKANPAASGGEVSAHGITVPKQQTSPNALVIVFKGEKYYVPKKIDGTSDIKVFKDEGLTQDVGSTIKSAGKTKPVFDELVRLSKEAGPAPTAAPQGKVDTAPLDTPATPSTGTLKRGSKGDAVSDLQKKLGITADGKFGPGTEKAVKDFQEKNGLKVDGIVGPETLKALDKPATANNTPTQSDSTPTQAGSTPAQSGGAGGEFDTTNTPAMSKDEMGELLKLLQKKNQKKESKSAIASVVLKEELTADEQKRLDDLMAKYKKLDSSKVPTDLQPDFKQIDDLLKAKPGLANPPSQISSAPSGISSAPTDDKDDSPQREDELTDMARDIFKAVDGMGTDEGAIKGVMRSIKTPKDWQKLSAAFKDLDENKTGQDMLKFILDDLDDKEAETHVYVFLRKLGIPHRTSTPIVITRKGQTVTKRPFEKSIDLYTIDNKGHGVFPKKAKQ